jgi:hypothetical protein
MLKYTAINQETIADGENWYVKYTYELPVQSSIRKIAFQDNSLTLWCEVNIEIMNRKFTKNVYLIPTGGYFDAVNWYYVDTLFVQHLVWHIYEEIVFE